MITFDTRNPHQALPELAHALQGGIHVDRRESRNGPVLVFNEPVNVRYERPLERVIFHPERDANPFFHLAESLWMLAGRNDVEFPSLFNSKFDQYSDDGVTFNAAYGHRWRHWFDGGDQLDQIARNLRNSPDCRRQVLSIWDGGHDLSLNSRDLPCNTHVYLQRGARGELNMMVCNRSNDVVWGMLGANAVQFSVLQEYMAARIGCEVGTYHQTTMNAHVYLDLYDGRELLAQMARKAPMPPERPSCPYSRSEVSSYSLVTDIDVFDEEVQEICRDVVTGEIVEGSYIEPFLQHVAAPLFRAYSWFRMKDEPRRFQCAQSLVEDCVATDWRRACHEWLLRREVRATHGP